MQMTLLIYTISQKKGWDPMDKTTKNRAATQVQSLEELLNRQVANMGVLYVKLHNYHWYVKGPDFFTLHAKFEELYNEVTLKMDAVAERLLTMKSSPVATMKEYMSLSSLHEASGVADAKTMVQTLIEDFATVCEELQEGIKLAEKTEDQSSADMLTGFKADFEKHMWMLRSYLG